MRKPVTAYKVNMLLIQCPNCANNLYVDVFYEVDDLVPCTQCGYDLYIENVKD